MFDIIVACTQDFGIGKAGFIPWYCKEELKLFRKKTFDSVLIMGRKTVENLPFLANRTIICVSRDEDLDTSMFTNDCFVVPDVETALSFVADLNKKIFVAGGGEIYNYCLRNLIEQIDSIHISFMETAVQCDTFFTFDMSGWIVKDSVIHDNFSHFVMKYEPNGEVQYLQLINEVRNNGIIKHGRNGKTRSSFINHLCFDLKKGFPLLTTKKMFTRGIIEELLFFIRGETDTKKLEAKNINIWKGNTNREFLDKIGMTERKEGIMGCMYGYQWRYFNAKYDENTGKPLEKGIDQFRYIIDTIRNDPDSRRILMTDFNPSQVGTGVLFPCHSIVNQFYVVDDHLDMFCYIRSSDMFLGLPFNIAMSALLLTIIAKLCDLKPNNLHITLGDSHLYEQHLEFVDIQVSRRPYTFPTLQINRDLQHIEDLEKLTVEDFIIENYRCHPCIKAKMVA